MPDWLFYPALCLLVFLTLAGIYLAGIEAIDFLRKPQNHQRNRTPPASDIHVSSWHQRGGTTAGVINLSLSEKKGDEDAGR